MKVFLGITIFFLQAFSFSVKAEKLSYFFDSSVQFDKKIPTPEEFLGYEIGGRITEHSQINAYFEKLASLSDRVSLIEIGKTHENRKLYVLIVSSPSNIKNLDSYKSARQKVRQGEKGNTPLIVFLGSTVHGNEASGSEAALLSAYYYVAAQNDFVKKQLEDGIYFIDPVRNPDGLERFASWVNSNASVNRHNTSQYDREHTEGWLRGRGNHYWFDLNRDWINTVHPESKARVAHYQQWLPNVQADHHEMWTNSTFFFEPTDPDGTESKYVPKSTYKLNNQFAEFYSKALDKIGSFYYTKESYDNKNPNFGSTYPDYNGAVGILFEQGSSRGIQQESENGIVTFAFTVRNQLVTSIATVDAANAHKSELEDLQKEYFKSSRAGKEAAKSFVIGDSYDASRLRKFIQLLLDHRLDVYETREDVTINGVKYEKGKSYIVPVGQANSGLVRIIFDESKEVINPENLAYGAGFSVAYSSGLSYATVSGASRGTKVDTLPEVVLPELNQSEYAYVVDYRDSQAQVLVLRLLEKNILVKTAFSPFSLTLADKTVDFSYGSLLIPVKNQTISSSDLYAELNTISKELKVPVYSVLTGYSAKGVDLGSSAFKTVELPKVLVVTGGNVSSTEAGEVWHLFDQKLQYPLVRVDVDFFNSVSLNEFNRIVLASGDYSFLGKQAVEKLQTWVKNGGTLIGINSASKWLIESGVSSLELKKDSVSSGALRGDLRIPTSVFETKINLSHPIAFGLTNESLPVLREGSVFLASSKNAVSQYTDNPLLNGYISEKPLRLLKGSASILVDRQGSGNIVLFAENPLFRGIWDATTRTFVNAIIVGNNISSYNSLR